MVTKLKSNQLDGKDVFSEFLITEDIFNQYSQKYWNHDHDDGSERKVINLFKLLQEKYDDIQQYKVINLNGYEGFLDGAFAINGEDEEFEENNNEEESIEENNLEDTENNEENNEEFYYKDAIFRNDKIIFKNGVIYLDNVGIEEIDDFENGCGLAFVLDNFNMTIKNCEIICPKAVDNGSVIRLYNGSKLSIIDCKIDTNFEDSGEDGKSFIGINTYDPYEEYEYNFPYNNAQNYDTIDPNNENPDNIRITVYSDEMMHLTERLIIIEFIAPDGVEGVIKVKENDNVLFESSLNDENYPNGGMILDKHFNNDIQKMIYFIHPDNLENIDLGEHTISVEFIPDAGQDLETITFSNATINLVDHYDIEIDENVNRPSEVYMVNTSVELKSENGGNGGDWLLSDKKVEANKKYWYKIITQGNNGRDYHYYILEDDGYTLQTLPELGEESPWQDAHYNYADFFRGNKFRIGSNPFSENEYWKGTISDVQITIDNEEWFNLNTASQDEYINENITNNNGVWSGFSHTNYLELDSLPEEYDNLEINIAAELVGEDPFYDDNALLCTTNDENYYGVQDERSECAGIWWQTGGNNNSFGFLNIEVNQSIVTVKDCSPISIYNFNNHNDDDLYFIKTTQNVIAAIDLFNNYIDIKGGFGEDYPYKALDINLDNDVLRATNNTFLPTCNVRWETQNTIHNRFENGEATFHAGENVYKLEVTPRQAEDSLNIGFQYDGYSFLNRMNIDPNNMDNLYNRYKFIYRSVEDDGETVASGWLLLNDYENEDQEYSAEDLISTEEIENPNTGFGVEIYDDYNEGNWFGVELGENVEYYRINQDFTIQNESEFHQHVGDNDESDASYDEPKVEEFSNNITEVYGYRDFLINGSKNITTNDKINYKGGKIDLFNLNNALNNNVYYNRFENYRGDFSSCFNEMKNKEADIIDLCNQEIQCNYTLENSENSLVPNFTIRNGSIRVFDGESNKLFKFINCNSITFENIHFSGDFYQGNQNIPVFEIENSDNIIFKNCTFAFRYGGLAKGEQKVIFKINNSDLSIENLSGNINAYCPYPEDINNQDYVDYNKEFGCKFIEIINSGSPLDCDNNIHIIGTKDCLRIANDLLNDDRPLGNQFNDVDIEQIFLDASKGNCQGELNGVILKTHGRTKNDNGWKAVVLQANHNADDLEFTNCYFMNGSLNIVPMDTSIEYEAGQDYQKDQSVYTIDEDGNINTYIVQENYTSSGDARQDEEDNNLLDITGGAIQRFQNVFYNFATGNMDRWTASYSASDKVSTKLYNLQDVDNGSVEHANENDILMYTDGQWKAISLQDLKNKLDALNNQ